jgi:hypothetical protein
VDLVRPPSATATAASLVRLLRLLSFRLHPHLSAPFAACPSEVQPRPPPSG